MSKDWSLNYHCVGYHVFTLPVAVFPRLIVFADLLLLANQIIVEYVQSAIRMLFLPLRVSRFSLGSPDTLGKNSRLRCVFRS
jgi:hypothetical protein